MWQFKQLSKENLMTSKNKILLVSGIADTFFSPNSDKKLVYGADLEAKITKFVNSVGAKSYYGFINLVSPYDSNKDINVFKQMPKSRTVNYKLFVPSLLDVYNNFEIMESTGDTKLVNASDFDFIFSPAQTEIHICGVDINGFYKGMIDTLLSKGYTVYLYSDMIKRFKNTEVDIVSIKHKNFEYCSHKSANLGRK